MTCPKCRGQMQEFERGGVRIDQCSNCRGIFLDYGELEHLTAAEARYGSAHSAPPPPPPMHGGGYAPPPPPPAYGAPGYGAPGYGGGHGPQYGHHGHYRQGHHGHYRARGHHGHYRKRKSFLGELFD